MTVADWIAIACLSATALGAFVVTALGGALRLPRMYSGRLPTLDPEADAKAKYVAGQWDAERMELELDYLYGLKERPVKKPVFGSAIVAGSAVVVPYASAARLPAGVRLNPISPQPAHSDPFCKCDACAAATKVYRRAVLERAAARHAAAQALHGGEVLDP